MTGAGPFLNHMTDDKGKPYGGTWGEVEKKIRECLCRVHPVHTGSELWKKVCLQALPFCGNGDRYGEAPTGRGCLAPKMEWEKGWAGDRMQRTKRSDLSLTIRHLTWRYRWSWVVRRLVLLKPKVQSSCYLSIFIFGVLLATHTKMILALWSKVIPWQSYVF